MAYGELVRSSCDVAALCYSLSYWGWVLILSSDPSVGMGASRSSPAASPRTGDPQQTVMLHLWRVCSIIATDVMVWHTIAYHVIAS